MNFYVAYANDLEQISQLVMLPERLPLQTDKALSDFATVQYLPIKILCRCPFIQALKREELQVTLLSIYLHHASCHALLGQAGYQLATQIC